MSEQHEPSSRPDPVKIAPGILAWYDRHRRRLPWRAEPGGKIDPYRVWLSEVMLQQTTVATVKERYRLFLERWPRVEDLAAAPLDDVLREWAGLGYYARARNLHKCAIAVVHDHGGRFPDNAAALKKLPGIGDYTATSIAAIAFDLPETVVDGNVERVIARLFRIEKQLPAGKKPIREAAARCTPASRPGDYAQAMMDLGATICAPTRPKCAICPFAGICTGRTIADTLPVRPPRKLKPTRRGTAFWLKRPDGAVLFRRRPERGLLGGMMEVPSNGWSDAEFEISSGNAPLARAVLLPSNGTIRHTFTHFHLELGLVKGHVDHDAPAPDACRWVPPDRFGDLALPTVMRKVVELAKKEML